MTFWRMEPCLLGLGADQTSPFYACKTFTNVVPACIVLGFAENELVLSFINRRPDGSTTLWVQVEEENDAKGIGTNLRMFFANYGW